MTYREWTQLSDSQRSEVIKKWDVYSDGYWHKLNKGAVSNFHEMFGHDERIRNITGGLWHGGHLIVAVCKTIPWDEMLDLPEWFYGFRVIQLGTESKQDAPQKEKCEL